MAIGLGGCIDGEKHHICRGNAIRDIGREVKVFASDTGEDLLKARLVNRQFKLAEIVPGIYALLVKVNHSDIQPWAMIGHHCHGRTTYITSSNTTNSLSHGFNFQKLEIGAKKRRELDQGAKPMILSPSAS